MLYLTRLEHLRLVGVAADLLCSQVVRSSDGPVLPASLQALHASAHPKNMLHPGFQTNWADRLSAGVVPLLNVRATYLHLQIFKGGVVAGPYPFTAVPVATVSRWPTGFGILHLDASSIKISFLNAVSIPGVRNVYRVPDSDVTLVPEPVRELCRF